jgi:UDP:flavonoid glycosyltransferase YjiC (YdhE family)
MLPLMRAARRAGHDVRVATGPDLVTPLRDRGLDALPVGPPFAESWAAHDEVWAAPEGSEERKMIDGVVALFGTPAAARLADLTAMVEDWRPDLVVHEVLELAGPLLAHRLGVPGVVHGLGPMFPMYAVLVGPAGAAAGDPALWEKLSAEACVDICPPALRPDGPAPWPHARPLRPSAGEPGRLPPEVEDALADGRPLAYFTLGTVKNKDAADLAVGMAALADYEGVVVVTTGGSVDLAALGPVPDNVVVAEFVPQAPLLARADLVVSHCGSGTMLGGLVHGVPQVAVPRGTDQPENAALLARSGAGVVVTADDYSVEAVRTAVLEVRDDPSYRRASARVQQEIAAMPEADEVLADLSA